MVDISGMSATILDIAVLVIATLFIGGFIIGLLYLFLKRKRWDYKVIWLDNSDGKTGGTDKGGVFVDKKTNYKMFFLQKAGVGLNPDNIPWKLIGNSKVVFLLKYGLKNFRFINMDVGRSITANVGEEDVNWAIIDYEKQKRIFMDSKLMQILPYAALVFVALVILIMIIFVLNKMEYLAEIARYGESSAQAIANAQSGTRIIQ